MARAQFWRSFDEKPAVEKQFAASATPSPVNGLSRGKSGRGANCEIVR